MSNEYREPYKIELTPEMVFNHLLHTATREDIARLDAKIESKYEALDSKIEAKYDALDAKIDKVEEKLNAKIDNIRSELKDIRSEILKEAKSTRLTIITCILGPILVGMVAYFFHIH